MGIKYKAGDKVGPYGHILLERIEKTKSNHWKCLFLCGWCNKNTFVTTLDHITRKDHEYDTPCWDVIIVDKNFLSGWTDIRNLKKILPSWRECPQILTI